MAEGIRPCNLERVNMSLNRQVQQQGAMAWVEGDQRRETDRRHPIIGPSSFAVSSTEWSLRGESQAQPAWSMIYSRGIRRDRRPQRAVCLDLALQPHSSGWLPLKVSSTPRDGGTSWKSQLWNWEAREHFPK